ncbi:flagellar biosynthesis protein FlhF [Marinisporobacter balticus]|uniref:Flagellar biosynthesis protein FlhF n=1 Tax=Marinisporobacter balticus TaxID=2018667 RepID=A0A4R2L746_9FIRM|nr:flagellar biosynthesis protein FlhF [Marinisporobacter balticus]TCO79929.1 flagellar biosynthesis protein FlhF [Marinisporobacter balticus]
MKVKRYIANNTQEAMLKIKTELGVNAVILHSRKIKRSGIIGFFKKPLIEMVAAIEENNEQNRKRINTQSERKNINKQGETDKIDELQYQVGNIQNMLNNFIHNIDEKKEPKKPALFEKYYSQLLENNIEKNIVDKIMNIAKKQMSFSNENEEAINKAIKIIIREYLGASQFVREKDDGQKRIVFVGPTGVGKTTTIAKLAARLAIGEKKSVALITADTYRIAAVEQLRTYSEILDIPIKVIYEPEEIEDAIEGYKDKDIILVDTAGRNHRSLEQLDEIKKLMNYIENPDVFLVISATTGYKDIRSIIDSYQFIEDYSLLFTKLDEANGFGNILNTKILTGKNLSYLTTGQSVPDDIEIANPEKIANIIVGKYYE